MCNQTGQLHTRHSFQLRETERKSEKKTQKPLAKFIYHKSTTFFADLLVVKHDTQNHVGGRLTDIILKANTCERTWFILRSGRLTHAGDLLRDQVLQQGVQHGVVPGVELVAVDADVEAEPVGVGLCPRLVGGRELLFLLLLVPIFTVPE